MGKMNYCLKKELEKLYSLKGEALALAYTEDVLGTYRNGIDALDARPAYMKWACEKIGDIRNAILEFRERSTIAYSYPYNQQLRGGHDGSYKEAVPEKEIVRGIMNYQRSGGVVANHAKGSRRRCVAEIVDYEVPTHRLRKGDCLSGKKIDAVGRSKNLDRLYIYEAKKNNSNETMLRCLLEAFSYSLFIDRVRFRESFGVRQDATIVLSPLIFEDSVAHKDLTEALHNPREKDLFNELLEKIRQIADVDVEFFVLRKSDFIKGGAHVFPNVGATEFKLEWLG